MSAPTPGIYMQKIINLILTLLMMILCFSHSANATQQTDQRPIKVMIISMFAPEADVWLSHLGPWETISVPGLSSDFPVIHCNKKDICVMTTGMGKANAATSVSAVVFSNKFNLQKTYFLIAGIGGIDPKEGTLGSAAWAHYLVDFGIQWELDSREIPHNWSSGFLGIDSQNPAEKGKLHYGTELFELNPALIQYALMLSKKIHLADSQTAKTIRAAYPYSPANQSPQVIQCDSLTSDTWWSGNHIGERAREWTKILTNNKGKYCIGQQEDNASYTVLERAGHANLIDISRVAVLRTGSDFDRPYPGESSEDNLIHYTQKGDFDLAVKNLYLTGNALVQDIITHWSEWELGVPKSA